MEEHASLDNYLDTLAGCRFCPMCKPASEVGNLLLIESHSTRARAMMLWSIAAGHAEWSDRKIEILYQSTLDGISQSWCVSHRAVTEYVRAAREQVWKSEMAPEVVVSAVERTTRGRSASASRSDTVLLAGEFAEWGDEEAAGVAAAAMGVDVVTAPTGATAYALGASDVAAETLGRTVGLLRAAQRVIADGPQTYWMLTTVLPQIEIEWAAEVVTISEYLLDSSELALSTGIGNGATAFFHDSRAATYLADSLAESKALDPSFTGPDEALGTGNSYELPRAVIDALGLPRVATRWSRSLSRSCGADDGLWATYPLIASDLAAATVRTAEEAGADILVVDSPIASALLADVRGHPGITVCWIADLGTQ